METEQILVEIASVDQVFADKMGQIVAKDKGSFEKVRRNLSILRSLDTENLASEALAKFQMPSKFIQIIELLRNSLILIPISLTWLSLAYSVSLFAKQPPSDSFPFLVLWEQGFSGRLPEYLRFSQVAFVDAGLVGLIIIFTFIVNVKTHIFDENALDRALLLKQKVSHFIMEIESDLYKKYAALAPTEEKNLDAIVAQFDKLASNVETQNRSLLNFITAEQERLSRLSEIQLENARGLQNASTTFYQAASVIIDSIQGLKDELHAWNSINEKNIFLLDRNTSQVTESFGQIAGLIGALDVIQNTVEVLSNNQKSTHADLEVSLTSLKGTLNKLNETLGHSVDSFELSRNAILEMLSDHQKSTHADLEVSLTSLKGTLNKLNETLDHSAYPFELSRSTSIEALSPLMNEPNKVTISKVPIDDTLSKSTLQNILAYGSFIPIMGFGFGSVSLAWSFAEKISARLFYMCLGGIALNVFLTVCIIMAIK